MSDPQLNSSLDLSLDPVFRDALREELVRTVDNTSARRPQRRRTRRWTRRRTLTLSAVLLVGLGGGGVAVATGALPLPGRPANHDALRPGPHHPGQAPELHPRRVHGLRHLTGPPLLHASADDQAVIEQLDEPQIPPQATIENLV